MEFIHDSYQPDETIAAVATPPGEGGVAIIRISGKEAITVASKVFSGPVQSFKSHTAHFGHILNSHKEHVDDVLLLPMLGKRSYTGEDTIEIHCHGGSLVTRRVLETVIKAGARPARPGEFTFKAFINGKMDLAQAEAVQELICAKNEHALDAAENQLKGVLSKKVSQFQEELTVLAAIIEAWVDFPEEGLEFATMDEICSSLESLAEKIKVLLSTFHDGRIVHEGISLCLVGCPNVGKSSLMNALLDKDRAIVSHIPGTTRDILEDHLRINGLNIKLMDTAGIRHSDELIEQEGIKRTKQAMSKSDLILLVLDATQEMDSDVRLLLDQSVKEKTIVVWNKIDLEAHSIVELDYPHIVHVSAKKQIGLDTLKKEIDSVIWKYGPPSKEEILITNTRHKEALESAAHSIEMVVNGLHSGVSPEFLTIDMRKALSELGKIIGTNITEDILSAIFSKFCIGK